MSSARAWQLHGCNYLGELVYYDVSLSIKDLSTNQISNL